jgi:hypothetical protein
LRGRVDAARVDRSDRRIPAGNSIHAPSHRRIRRIADRRGESLRLAQQDGRGFRCDRHRNI